MKNTFICESCEKSLSIQHLEPQEQEICILCIALIDLQNADDYKERWVAQQRVNELAQELGK